jgi:hypothetical protein
MAAVPPIFFDAIETGDHSILRAFKNLKKITVVIEKEAADAIRLIVAARSFEDVFESLGREAFGGGTQISQDVD